MALYVTLLSGVKLLGERLEQRGEQFVRRQEKHVVLDAGDRLHADQG